ncbi:MAG: phosphoribosylanthranilate isomerase [Candidatus Omnitrophica bacterium]|nr:phosphoribosylanthranilate isomerase [Candidatus Omnitrophota bacterium]
MTRVKFCGITNRADALAAARLGIHALGFVFIENTPRYVDPDKAKEIISELSPFVMRVGVFANQDIKTIESTAKTCSLDIIQLHGDEDNAICNKITKKYRVIKALRVKNDSVLDSIAKYRGVNAILLDAYSEKKLGGTATSFDWQIAKQARRFGLPIILSGGLNIDNIKSAIEQVNPYAVDVSSGIERSPGIKDHELMAQFLASVWEEEWGL